MSLLKPKIHWEQDYSPKFLIGGIIFIFLIFSLRLWFLQILKGDYFAKKARDNRTRLVKIYAPRGLIFDRNGKLLAYNEPAYDLAIVREDCKQKGLNVYLQYISRLFGLKVKELLEIIKKNKFRVKSFEPLVLVPNLSFRDLARVEARSEQWPGIKIIVRPRRKYSYSKPFSHVLGYVGPVNEQELKEDDSLSGGDYVGKTGLEKVFDKVLRGKKGLKKLEVNALGRVFSEQVLSPPVPGQDLVLSLDWHLQCKIYDILKGRAGAVVVMDPDTGQVLALVSSPGYDSNKLVLGVDAKEWKKLLKDPLGILQNKVVQGTYPPGSVFKLLMAGFFLEKKAKFSSKDVVFCPGYFKLGRRVFHCWKKGGHGWVDLKRAIIQSCDVYFYKESQDMDIDELHDFALANGFGVLTGISLPFEKRGLIPSRQWKLKRFKAPWQRGENLNVAIGQGYVLVTPIQVARFISALINGGFLYTPSLFLNKKQIAPKSIPINQIHRQQIVEAMIATVESPHGTARRLKIKGLTIGAKTGTAQVVKLKQEDRGKKIHEIPYRFRDHAWMASFGIIHGRKYVVVCLMVHGGHGASGAGPVVRSIYEYLSHRTKGTNK
ncbi:MAG: penicillin-binding protein 2 [Desulfonauticus sp.]|nr:penicillin-binding protein 2 [Desulfonauticus sp.]